MQLKREQEKYMIPLMSQKQTENETEETIIRCGIGEYGVCIDDIGKPGKFRYLLAGTYTGEKVPEGMCVYEFRIW